MRNQIHQSLIAATQRNYEMGKVTYRQVADAAPEVTKQGLADFHDPHKLMTTQTISGIGSITKQFTAATLLKIWDEEISSGNSVNFPNGIDTTFSHFLPKLRLHFPECHDIFDQFQNNRNFEKITLRNLLNHTHGLGARSDKALMQLMHKNADRPLELFEIINSTIQPAESQYDQHYYSNVGYDLAAMIIEAITNQRFDDVVRNMVLLPNQLFNTHPQSDHIALYDVPENNMARGFVFNPYHPEVETNFNTRSNTRAAGGFKSTLEDLAKFASLYMGTEMFENEEVKRAIKENEKGVELWKIDENGKKKVGSGVRPSMQKDDRYHLAMTVNADGSVGHPGVDFDFLANLRFYPESREVKVSLSVVENLSADICKNFFTKTDPIILEKIGRFWKDVLQPKMKIENDPEFGGEVWNGIIELELSKEENAEYLSALEQFSALHQRILSMPRDKLIQNYKTLTSRATIDALDLTTHQEPSINPEKIYAEKMSQVKGSKFKEI